jgi:membrane associated rhomboid family serine protease
MQIWKNFKIAAAAVAFLWLVYFINQVTAVDLRLWGLRPRSAEGLPGIILAPFLHGDLSHLIANSGACFVLLALALSFNRKLAIKAILIIVMVGGGLTWMFGNSNAVHIGASGVIFGLLAFLLSLGALRREWSAFLISAAVLVLYGGAVRSLVDYAPETSWTGHFFGFVSGMLAAWWTKIDRIKK